MKKVYKTLGLLSFFMMVAALISSAQNVTRNMVIVEEFTGAWCVNCPGAAMGIEDLLANDWPVGAIAYHNNDNYETEEALARDAYYEIWGYPTTIFDGVLSEIGGSPNYSDYESFWPLVEQRMNVLTPITIELENANYNGTTFTANVVMESVGAVTATNLRLYAAITESQIVEAWQNQYYFMEVERDMFNGSEGTSVDLVNNTSQTVSIVFTVDPSWEAANCEVVVFVQDTTTKEIFNGNKQHVLFLEPASNLTVEVNGSTASLNWDTPESVQGFNIYRNYEFLEYTTEATYEDAGLEDGEYMYYVRAVYDEGASGWSNHVTVNVGNFLCVPVYGDGCVYSTDINDFILNEIENTNSGCGNLNGTGWSQYFEMGPANVEAGETYNLTVSTESIYDDEYFTVWVDWNDNLEFEESEKVVQGIMAFADILYNFDFAVPEDAPEGVHFLRMRSQYHEVVLDPCANYSNGEAEDYLIHVGEILFPPPTNLAAEVIEADVNLNWDAPNVTLLGYNVYRDGDFIDFTEESSYSDLGLAGTYTYYVKALYDDGESRASNYVTVSAGNFLCSPSYTQGCGGGDGFTDFALNEIQNNGSGCADLNAVGWSQYLDMGPAIIEVGQTYTVSMATGYENNNASVWIDWNDNWTFEPEEMVINNFNFTLAGQIYNVDFEVPDNASVGLHFMRARAVFSIPCNDPCIEYTFGEAEDYLVQVVPTIGIEEFLNENIQMYPNPTHGIVYIESENAMRGVNIYNMTGQLVFEQNISANKIQVKTTDFLPGFYFVKVLFSNQIITRKLVIE